MKHRTAFSLVELSIVLVILGLLVGGILAGQSLIRASELRAAGAEYQRYVTSAHAFRDKYFAIPGDFAKATDIWTAAAAGTACATTNNGNATTCNGNGDGLVLPSTNSNESFRFWQHLANAGLVEGQYSGVEDGSTTYSATRRNAPSSKTGGLWFAWNWTVSSGSGSTFDGAYNNFFELGGAEANGDPVVSLFKPEELWNIDTKLDDGKPATGKLVMRGYGVLSDCSDATVSTTFTANYKVSNPNIACVAIFRNAF